MMKLVTIRLLCLLWMYQSNSFLMVSSFGLSSPLLIRVKRNINQQQLLSQNQPENLCKQGIICNGLGARNSNHQSSSLLSLSSTSVTEKLSPKEDVDDASSPFLNFLDRTLIGPIVRITNHIPAVLTLFYFGLVSMVSMMNGGKMNAPMPMPTLSSVLTRFVGTTSNAEFSKLYPTLITPSNPVFLIWPIIAASQVITLSLSALLATSGSAPLFDQNDLTTLSLSNLIATAWIIIASRTVVGDVVPIGSILVLPLVPLISGYQLRRRERERVRAFGEKNHKSPLLSSDFVFQLFGSFTKIASLLALTVELQHGKRILPFLFYNRPELSAFVFLYLYSTDILGKGSIIKRIINAVAVAGIWSKRIADGTLGSLLFSPSFWITSGIVVSALKQLFDSE